jgi:hypothetical protein
MRAAIYARYSSENQRPESIEDQIGACRRLARERGFSVVEDHTYADQAQSRARRERQELAALVASAQSEQFDVVLVDDNAGNRQEQHDCEEASHVASHTAAPPNSAGLRRIRGGVATRNSAEHHRVGDGGPAADIALSHDAAGGLSRRVEAGNRMLTPIEDAGF